MNERNGLANTAVALVPVILAAQMILAFEIADLLGDLGALVFFGTLAAVGVGQLIASKWPTWRAGRWTFFGPTQGDRTCLRHYCCGYALIASAALMTLIVGLTPF